MELEPVTIWKSTQETSFLGLASRFLTQSMKKLLYISPHVMSNQRTGSISEWICSVELRLFAWATRGILSVLP